MAVATPSRPVGLSLPTKIFLAFAAIIVAFAATTTYSLFRHHRTLQDLGLLGGGLLSVSLAVGEIRTTQELFVTTLESDPSGRAQWLSTVRQLRPRELQGTARALRQARALAQHGDDAELLDQLASELDEAAVLAEGHEARYRQLFEAIAGGDAARADELRHSLSRREREMSTRLRQVQDRLEERITRIARTAEREERQLLWALLILTGGALVVAAVATVLSYLAVAPLSRLMDGVIAVGAGDLTQRVDISGRDEIGTLANEFNRMTERLAEREERLIRSERLAAIGRVASKVTHEIRNPLNVLRLNAEILAEDISLLGEPEQTAEPLKALTAMTEVLERLEGLTEEYLRYARLPKPRLVAGCLDESVEEFLGFGRADLEKRGVEVRVALAGDLPQVRLDEGQIQQMLTNLVRNACEAMPEGGRLTIATARAEGGVLLTVEDDGEGMEQASLDTIFDPFFTTKERGTGLGLPLAGQIVAEHEGRIECRSSRGGGTLFTIWLPVAGGPGQPRREDEEEEA